jgi:hypothetical protein
MGDSRALLRSAQLLLLVKELRKVEGGAEPVDSESPLETLEAVEVYVRRMVRAALILGLVVTSVAVAAPAEWTLPPLPADWKDITEPTMKEPEMVARRQAILDKGGTVDLKAFGTDGNGGIMVLVSQFADTSTTLAELEGVITGSRGGTTDTGKEISFNVERTPTMVVSTQQRISHGVPVTAKTYVGYLKSGPLRAISFVCFDEPERCAPLLDKVSVDVSVLQPLGALEKPRKKLTPFRIGMLVGGACVVLFILGAMWKGRRS